MSEFRGHHKSSMYPPTSHNPQPHINPMFSSSSKVHINPNFSATNTPSIQATPSEYSTSSKHASKVLLNPKVRKLSINCPNYLKYFSLSRVHQAALTSLPSLQCI